MTDSVRIIHDTLYVKGADALDILTKTDAFYQSSWDKLIFLISLIVGVGGGIFGLILPLVQQNRQNKEFKSSLESIRKEMQSDIAQATTNLNQTIENKIITSIVDVELKIDEKHNYGLALIYHNIAIDMSMHQDAAQSYQCMTIALSYYCKALTISEASSNVISVLEMMHKLLSIIYDREIKKINALGQDLDFRYFTVKVIPYVIKTFQHNAGILNLCHKILTLLNDPKFNNS